MKTLLILLLAVCAAFADPITITPTATQQAGLQFAADQFNASEKSKWDAAQALLPLNERTQYVPIAPEAYAAVRFADVLDSYAKGIVTARAAEPETKDLIERILKATDAQRVAVKAAIDEAILKAVK